jgi:hypothetical protein
MNEKGWCSVISSTTISESIGSKSENIWPSSNNFDWVIFESNCILVCQRCNLFITRFEWSDWLIWSFSRINTERRVIT